MYIKRVRYVYIYIYMYFIYVIIIAVRINTRRRWRWRRYTRIIAVRASNYRPRARYTVDATATPSRSSCA